MLLFCLVFQVLVFKDQIFYGIVTGDEYLEILMNQVVLQLQKQPNSHDLYFQGGAARHYSRAFCNYLDETFPEKWLAEED